MTDSPPEAPATRDETAQESSCVECLEPIAVDASRCPACGAAQKPPGLGARALKGASILIALAAFVSGLHQLTNAAIERIEAGSVLRQKLATVRALVDQAEYRTAWDLLETASGGAEAAETRYALARAWALDGDSISSGMSLPELGSLLSPALAAVANSGDSRRRAEAKALLAYTQLLKAREEPVATRFVDVYEQSLREDERSVFAHLLLGSYLLSYERGASERGVRELDRAVELSADMPKERSWVRRWQLAALTSGAAWARAHDDVPATQRSEWPMRLAVLRVANELRQSGEPIPSSGFEASSRSPGNYWKRLNAPYDVGSPEALAELRKSLPTDDHLAVIRWLDEAGREEGPSAARGYVAALLYLDRGDTDAAVAELRSRPKSLALGRAYEALHVEITGEPLTPLRERDPWAWRSQVLASAKPGDPELAHAIEEIDEYMVWHRRGERHWTDDALAAVTSRRAARNIGGTPGPDAATPDERVLTHKLALYEGELLFSAGRPEQAASRLRDLTAALPEGDPLRARALVELAAALAAGGDADANNNDRYAEVVALLREAVEGEGWSDWAWIRWRPVFDPLDQRADYEALLERHGRRAGPPAGVEIAGAR